jgi:hypothetical protein
MRVAVEFASLFDERDFRFLREFLFGKENVWVLFHVTWTARHVETAEETASRNLK